MGFQHQYFYFFGLVFKDVKDETSAHIKQMGLKIVFWGFFWPHCTACRILVPGPGIEPTPPAVEAWSLNSWTTREVLFLLSFCF